MLVNSFPFLPHIPSQNGMRPFSGLSNAINPVHFVFCFSAFYKVLRRMEYMRYRMQCTKKIDKN